MAKESDFGKGLVYNLILFANHFSNEQAYMLAKLHIFIKMSEEDRKLAFSDNPPSNLNYGFNKEVKWWFESIVPIHETIEGALSSWITLWANGASDHLYEIQIPPAWEKKKLGKKIFELQAKGLTMGHGFTGKVYTMDDFAELDDLTKEIGRLVDKELGVDVIKAKWE